MSETETEQGAQELVPHKHDLVGGADDGKQGRNHVHE
jgi:hypothetical protein